MPYARSQTVSPYDIQIMHIWSRVVRRAFLCGYDKVLNKDYEHRREWIRERLKKLAGIYSIEVITFSIMHNHYHLLVRTRPDLVEEMTDEEVVRALLKLRFDYWFLESGDDRKKVKAEINRRINDKQGMKRDRARLSDVSKMMQSLNQSIARRANQEDEVKGRFFEARFGHEVLVDTPDILACAMYIDLNPVRAETASTPEESEYTGIYERVNDLRMFVGQNDGDLRIGLSHSGMDVHRWERLGEGSSSWLAPLSIAKPADSKESEERAEKEKPDLEKELQRLNRQGVLPMSLLEYLELLDFTGRQKRADKRGAIDPSISPVLERLGFDFEGLSDAIESLAESHTAYFTATERCGRPDVLPDQRAARGEPKQA